MERFPYLAGLLSENLRNSTTKEERLRGWAKPPSQTEIEKCERAERMIRQAIEEDPKLSKMDISVYAKGSYANRTNIPSDSDVDIAVVANYYHFNDYPAGKTASDFGFSNTGYLYTTFKDNVLEAIENKFGKSEVSAGEKCVKVRSNSCRVDADVVPHFVHKRFALDKSSQEGVSIKTAGTTIYNWPKQDYENGVQKNERTGKRYKALVRIIKNTRSKMREEGYTSAKNVASYLIACLVWNVPDYFFDEDSYEKMTADAIDFLIEQTSDLANVKEWGEVNELKYLFRTSQPWKLDEVHQFLRDAKTFLAEM
ncbi:MAG: nucleotidyltransferase [Bdellovibrionaceae bacterium]|nr:nucleotidyltransferase [Pseudobdellovibrionaceae bacterium]